MFTFSMWGSLYILPYVSNISKCLANTQKYSAMVHLITSKIYAAWETDEIIGFELWRNIGLAMAAVALVTLVLLANIRICVYVICIVVITLTDIVGFLHFWGITIDILSAVNIVLAIGLCVDYAVHIAHAFLISEGSRQERATNCVKTIGMAVLNGGVTTFLALFFCSFSSAHVFQTFFKVSSRNIFNYIKVVPEKCSFSRSHPF